MIARRSTLRGLAALVIGGVLASCGDLESPSALADKAPPSVTEDVVRMVPGEARTLTLLQGGKNVAWSVRDTHVATVDPGGVLRAATPGMTWAFGSRGSERDSARIVVSFDDLQPGSVAYSVGGVTTELQLQGVSSAARSVDGRSLFTRIAATTGQRPEEVFLDGAFILRDTILSMRLDGEPVVGLREIQPIDVSTDEEGRIHIRGNEPAFLWLDLTDRPDHAVVYVPVTPLQLEIDASSIPGEAGGAPGRLVGRVSFEAAGLLVQTGPGGHRIVGQASEEIEPFFAEFDLVQRLRPIGNGRMTVEGGPVGISDMSFQNPVAGMVRGGLMVTAGYAGNPSGALARTQLWIGTPSVGEHELSRLALEGLLNRSALTSQRAWAWTETGTLADMKAGGLPNLGLSDGGTLRITRYEAPAEDRWGTLEATVEARQYLAFGGAPGARQTVSLHLTAPIAPTSVLVPAPLPPVASGSGAGRVPGIVRVGNGEEVVTGQFYGPSAPIAGAEATLVWADGSASVRANEIGRFMFTGVQPGTYRLEFEVPAGYTLAEGQSESVGPFEVTANRNPHSPVFVPIYLADAAGSGRLVVHATTHDPVEPVQGVVARVRLAGSDAILQTLSTAELSQGDGQARTSLPIGRYALDFVAPHGYHLADSQLGTVEIDVGSGETTEVEVLVTRMDSSS